MSQAKQVYGLIAKGQACSIDAIVLATGHSREKVRSALDWLLYEGLIQRGEQYRPARYTATFEREAPRPVGRPFGSTNEMTTAKLLAKQPELSMVWR